MSDGGYGGAPYGGLAGKRFVDRHSDDSSVRWVHLFALSLPSVTLRWTDDQLPVYWDGQVYVPYVVSLEALTTEAGQIAGAGLTIGNADNAFCAHLFVEDVTGSIVEIWQAWMDANVPGQIPQDVRQLPTTRVTNVGLLRSGASSEAKLMLGPYSDPQTKLLPARTVASLLRV